MKSWKECFKEESETRLDTDINKLCCYGIKPLDDSLGCIRKNELVVIGADSGTGKSELIISIARINAKKGKKVALYYLEGGHLEAMARMKWRDIADEYYLKYTQAKIDMDYTKWINNQISDPNNILNKIESEIWNRYEKEYKDNLCIYPVDTNFTIDELTRSLYEHHNFKPQDQESLPKTKECFDLDLIIIDHLQYFSLSQGESEIKEITYILREVKKISDLYKIPVILVSHLRKKYKDRGLPDQEDFYGSSNIPKISTTSIVISPDYNNDNTSDNIFPTYFRIVKSRVGIRPNHAICIDFDLTRRSYSEEYKIFHVNRNGDVAPEPLSELNLPKWARRNQEGIKQKCPY